MAETIVAVVLTGVIAAALAGLLTWLLAARRTAAQTTRAVNAETQLQASQQRAQELEERLHTTEQRERSAAEALARSEVALEAERARAAEKQTALETAEQRLRQQEEQLRRTGDALARAETALQSEQTHHAEKLAALEAAEQRLRDAFASLSSDALQASLGQFLTLADERLGRQQQVAQTNLSELMSPLRDALIQQHTHTRELEEARQTAYGSISQHLSSIQEEHRLLRQETASLVKALRQPHVRGRWGEIQLRRVVELAGMSACCDFVEQESVSDASGARQRPDLQVRLPNQRTIVVDAKVPLSAYLDALEAADEATRAACTQRHASQIRAHVNDMAKRDYQRQIDGAYDFLVLFIPGEVFYSAALEQDHELLEYAFKKQIILATPTTLIALLKAVALGWREVRLSDDARQIKETAEKIYQYLGTLAGHISDLGAGLRKSVDSYNKTIGSLERNLLSSAKRMRELEVSQSPIAALPPLEAALRVFSKAELLAAQERGELPDSEAESGEIVPAV